MSLVSEPGSEVRGVATWKRRPDGAVTEESCVVALARVVLNFILPAEPISAADTVVLLGVPEPGSEMLKSVERCTVDGG